MSACAPGAAVKGCVRFHRVVLRYCDDGAFRPVAEPAQSASILSTARAGAGGSPSAAGHETAAKIRAAAGLLGPTATATAAAPRAFACKAFGRPR